MGYIAPIDPRVYELPASREEMRLRRWLLSNEPRMGNRQCVSLAKLAAEDFRSVRCWRRGLPVLSARLPIGTPIATFMDRKGKDSEHYDGGVGVGAPGNMTTHAAIFIDYVTDANGTVEAILVFDQHALLTEFRRMIYPVDPSAFGTATASNYYVINDEDGVPLGARSNSCWGPTPRSRRNNRGLSNLSSGFSEMHM